MTARSLTGKLSDLFDLESDYLSYEGLVVKFGRNEFATDDEILLARSEVVIPDDYIKLLRQHNGCTLFQFEDLGGFELLGTSGLIKETRFHKENFKEYWEDNLTVFCNLICDGDFVSFRNFSDGTYEILDCYHDDLPKNWKIITNSFDAFLERLIDERGLRYWM